MNYQEAEKITESIIKNKVYDNIILDDYENEHYFRRYSTKYHSLPNFIFENISGFSNPNVITSSSFTLKTLKKNLYIKIKDGKFISDNKYIKKLNKKEDNYTISFRKNRLGYSFDKNQIILYEK